MENQLFNDDCFNVLPTLKDNSVQLVCVDLPYGQTACKWDCAIDLEKMWIELKRILKPNGQAVFFTTTKFGYKLIASNPKWFRYDIVWEKTMPVGFLSCNKQPLRNHEMIYMFHNPTKPKNLSWIYNPQKTEGKSYKKNTIAEDVIYGVGRTNTTNISGDRHPKSVLKIPNPNSKSQHPTQKPVDLCEWLIKTYSNEGDMVLDFTMGSGSTIIGCINTNRKYIGIEKDKDIFLTAVKRVEERNGLIN